MQQVYPDQGLPTWMLRMTGFDTLVGLYVNNAVIDRSITLLGLTEATFGGYARATVVAGTWAVSSAGHLGFAIASALAFNNTSGAPQNVYGYFMADITFTILIAVAKFDVTPLVIADGDAYVMIPSLGDLSRAIVSP